MLGLQQCVSTKNGTAISNPVLHRDCRSISGSTTSNVFPDGGQGSPATLTGPPGSNTPAYTASPAPSGSSTPGPAPPQGANFPGGPPNSTTPQYNGPNQSGPFGSPVDPLRSSNAPPFGRPNSSGPSFGSPHFASPSGTFQFEMPSNSPFPHNPMAQIGGHMMAGPQPMDRMEQGDGAEMLEEYSMETGILIRRAWKKKNDVLCMKPENDGPTALFNWDVEIGDAFSNTTNDDFMVKESQTAPILSKRITRNNIEWRIRNLPYSKETYLVTADKTKNAIIVRTTNKKYFKEIPVPDLNRCGLSPEQESITIAHQHNTLIISYRKPSLVTQMEVETLKILQDVETETDEDVNLMKHLYGLTKA